MLIPPIYRFTSKIAKLLSSIEASKEVIRSFEILPEIEQNLRRQSVLKSSLYSARIEGNTLVLEDIKTLSSQNRMKLEISNILKAKKYILKGSIKKITSNEILKIHEIVMNGLTDKKNHGKYRTDMEAIFNSAGVAIFMPPPPRHVKKLIQKLIIYTQSQKEKFVPIKAVLVHFTFEKIHPFLDGNGRTGRLVMEHVLTSEGYNPKGLLNIDEYLDNHRSLYYRMLEEPEKDCTEYLEFMLYAMSQVLEDAKHTVLQKKSYDQSDLLLPRHGEILKIIEEQKFVKFDTIKRRFSKVNERTLRYDLKKLIDRSLILKLGTTKGVYYKANNNKE